MGKAVTRVATLVIFFVVFVATLSGRAAWADPANLLAPRIQEEAPLPPGVALSQPAAAEPKSSGGLLTKWWFWAGVGVVAAAAIGVTVFAVTTSGSSSGPPSSTLGNMNVFGGK